MSKASKFFDAIKHIGRKSTNDGEPTFRVPTVKFDPSRVTDAVQADIWENILLLEEINSDSADRIYDAALRSISAGRDLSVLHDALMQLNGRGMTTRRAGEISLLLNNRATVLMNKERQESLGVGQAVWLHSGAPCEADPKRPTGQDAAHRAANGKSFDISSGMLLNGKRTWPGFEPGCRCISKSVIPGFS